MSVMATPSLTLYPARAGARPMTSDDLWAIPRVGAPTPSPDGSSVVVPVTTYDMEKNVGRTRLWLVPAKGGEPRPLTSADVSSQEAVFSPDGKRIAFVRKLEGGKAQLYVMPIDGGEPEKLTDLPLGAFNPMWLPDGSGLVFAAMLIKGHLTPEATKAEIERRDKDPVKAHVTEDRVFRYWDTWLTTGEVPHLFLLDLATKQMRDLMPESDAWFEWMDPSGQFDVSPDGKEIVYAGVGVHGDLGELRSALWLMPITGGKARNLTPDHPADAFRPRYTPDGRAIVYGMQHDLHFYADRVRLMRYDRASQKHEGVLENWDLTPAGWDFAADGALYFEVEDNARVSVYALAPGETEPREVLRGGTVTGLAIGSDQLYFGHQTMSEPTEVYTCPTRGGTPTRLTTFTKQATAGFGTGEVREYQFEGAYGENVQMFVVLPPGYQAGKRYPLVHVVHGGPHGISGDAFHPRWNSQLFASPGYVVAQVNFQGSTSWGQEFAKCIQGGWGDRPYLDVMKGTDLLIAVGLVDETRMSAAGGSYGGYLVAWIATQTNRFRCVVNHAGVYDTLSQYASDVTQGRAASFGGEPWAGLEVIDRWNPARFTAKLETPMLVIHGERDYRVPVTQGLECYGMLKAKGIPARLVYFPDENHWVLKPRNSLLWYQEVHAWLARWMKG